MDSNFFHEDQRRVSKNLVVVTAKSLFFLDRHPSKHTPVIAVGFSVYLIGF